MKISMLVYPGMTPLDLVGPLQTWSQLPDVSIEFVWKNTDPIATDTGMVIVPSHSFAQAAESPDILFAPGGAMPTMELMGDVETIGFLKGRGEKAQWVTSVCTGALLLGAAGLLDGYKATTHWSAVPMLENFGAIPTEGRYVIDRNRATGGGVTAGIDFGLAMVAHIIGEEEAKAIQLGLEYAPQPPFNTGTPENATPELIQTVLDSFSTS